MTDKAITEFSAKDEDKARGWYESWRPRIHKWVESNADSLWADSLLLPDLFMLCLGLLLDKRTPANFRLLLLLAVQFVISPLDFIPEAAFGALGLTDDLCILLLVLKAIFDAEFETLEAVIKDHWHGDEHPAVTVARLLQRIGEFAGDMLSLVTAIFRRWRSSKGSRGVADRDPEPVPIT